MRARLRIVMFLIAAVGMAGLCTIRVTMQGMVAAAMVVFGIYIASHGQLTPGGGFQGGVILATAPFNRSC